MLSVSLRDYDQRWSSPGTLFLVTVATLTTISVVVTLARVDAVHGRILHYRHLLDRATEIMRAELDRADRGLSASFLFLANAPGVGSVSASASFTAYFDLVKKLAFEPKITARCIFLDPDRQDAFLRATFSQRLEPAALQAKIAANRSRLDELEKSLTVHSTGKSLEFLNQDITEVPFHLWCTSTKALIAITLNHPVTDDASPVSFLGFETGDVRRIEHTSPA